MPHEAFYSTAAQVIPVWILAMTLGERFLLRELVTVILGDRHARAVYAVMATYVGALFLAEAVAIIALLTERDYVGARSFVALVLLAGVAPVLLVISLFAIRTARELGDP